MALSPSLLGISVGGVGIGQETSSFDALLHQLKVAHEQELAALRVQSEKKDCELAVWAGDDNFTSPIKPDTTKRIDIADQEDPVRNGGASNVSMHIRGSQTAESMAEQISSVFYRRRMRLKRIFEVNEAIEEEEHNRENVIYNQDGPLQRLIALDGHHLAMFVDSVMSWVIAANAIFIGLSQDRNHHSKGNLDAWEIIDMVFLGTFILELGAKLLIKGFREYFCGTDKFSNVFDTLLIVLDAAQVAIDVFAKEASSQLEDAGMPSASLFRVVRLVRLVRLLRLMGSDSFKDLLTMIQSMLSGSLTLLWAMLLFVLIVYVVAVLCRTSYGVHQEEQVHYYFRSVPRSMLTIFRCSFGDCASKSGVPIPEYIVSAYGGAHGFCFCVFVFTVTIGLFNIISAIFVESTCVYASDQKKKNAQLRLEDERLWAGSVSTIIYELISASSSSQNDIVPDGLVKHLDEIVHMEFTRGTIDELVHSVSHGSHGVLVPGVKDERYCRVKDALDALDIEPNDHNRLSDILDPDHSGTIGVLELVEGLRRLRGDPRRSDAVSVALMVRSLQERVDEILGKVAHLQHLPALLSLREDHDQSETKLAQTVMYL